MLASFVLFEAAAALPKHFFLSAVPGPLVNLSVIETEPIREFPDSGRVPVRVALVFMLKCEL